MTKSPSPSVRAVALNCTLKPGPDQSSTDRMLDLLTEQLTGHGVECTRFRVVDEGVQFGVSSDEGEGDGWPNLRAAIVEAELLVIGTPIWLGHPSSVCQMVLERLDAFISETRDRGRPISWDRVGLVGIVGNEDGAHAVAASVFQGVNDVGFSLAPGGAIYWVGEAMGEVDFKDLDAAPQKVVDAAKAAVANAVHLAALLRDHAYPPAPE